jgi:hypothetical protein
LLERNLDKLLRIAIQKQVAKKKLSRLREVCAELLLVQSMPNGQHLCRVERSPIPFIVDRVLIPEC